MPVGLNSHPQRMRTQGMEEVKEAAEAWEKQAQASLQQLDRLKDILEESAAWSGPGAVSRPVAEAKMPGQEGSTTEEGDGQEAGSESKDESRDLEKRYLQVVHCSAPLRGLGALMNGCGNCDLPHIALHDYNEVYTASRSNKAQRSWQV